MKRIILMIFAALLLAGCAFNLCPLVKKEMVENQGRQKIKASVLVDIPKEFDEFNYASQYEETGITTLVCVIYLGEGIRAVFPDYLKDIFTDVSFNATNKDRGYYGFVATPKFTNTRFGLGNNSIETTIEILFISKDRSRFFRFTGSGKETGMYPDGQFNKNFGAVALSQALQSLRDEIYKHEEMFH